MNNCEFENLEYKAPFLDLSREEDVKGIKTCRLC